MKVVIGVKKIIDKKEVAMSNSLVKCKFRLTKEEQNLVFLVASQIHSNDEDFKTYKVSTKDLEKATGVKQFNRQRIKEMSLSILSKPLLLPDRTALNWFSAIKPVDNEAALEVRFDKALKPYLLQLSERFTKAELGHLFTFKSKYSSRLYLLLKSKLGEQSKFANTIDCVLFVDEMINDFDLPKSYKNRYSNFKAKFLLQSLKEINSISDIFVTFDDTDHHRKAGKKVVSIKFMVSKIAESEEELNQNILNTKTKADYIPESLNKKARDIILSDELDLDINYVRHIFQHYLIEDIEKVCELVYNSWDNEMLMSRQQLFWGKIRKLNEKKTQNHTFGFDEV